MPPRWPSGAKVSASFAAPLAASLTLMGSGKAEMSNSRWPVTGSRHSARAQLSRSHTACKRLRWPSPQVTTTHSPWFATPAICVLRRLSSRVFRRWTAAKTGIPLQRFRWLRTMPWEVRQPPKNATTFDNAWRSGRYARGKPHRGTVIPIRTSGRGTASRAGCLPVMCGASSNVLTAPDSDQGSSDHETDSSLRHTSVRLKIE